METTVEHAEPATDPRWMRVTEALGLIMLLGLLIPVMARLLGWEAGPLALVVSFMPWVTLAAVLPVVVLVLARSWVLAVAAVGVLALCIAWQLPLFTGGGNGETVLTVASVNMKFGEADAVAIVSLVEQQGVDILSVSEITPEAQAALAAAGLEELMPYSEVAAEPGITGTGLWSRLPISEPYELDGFLSRQIGATVEGPNGSFTMLAVHPRAPGSRNHDDWAAELETLKVALADVSGPVVVAGDFNTTRDHRVFRDIEALGYDNAADEAGSGFAPTFRQGNEMPPLVVIDHVLERHTGMSASRTQTVVIPGGDHRALVVTYALEG